MGAKTLISGAALLAACLTGAMGAHAQSAVDAMSLSGYDLRGTARFMSMGGAFTALGGDLSTLTQNPAGVGIYRTSDIGVTMDIDIMNVKSSGNGTPFSSGQTKVYCPNFGYVGSWKLNSDVMPFFNWGVSYGRTKSFDRKYSAAIGHLNGSLTDYVAAFTEKEGWTNNDLYSGSGYNPYSNGSAPWMSILFYNGCLINPNGSSTDQYNGLTTLGGSAAGEAVVEERGYVDEYSINLGGNFVNMVYWGLGVGIKDISFQQAAYWGEDITGGEMPYKDNHGTLVTGNGNGAYGLNSYKHIWGSGADVKFGLIIKPVNELRIGLAVHSPTWYHLEQEGSADVTVQTDTPSRFSYTTWTNNGSSDYFRWHFNTPWTFTAGIASVIAYKGIVSIDYQYDAYNKMKLNSENGWEYPIPNEDVKHYTQGVSTVRVGAEYRVAPSFSVRAGFCYSSSPTVSESKVNELNQSNLNIDTDGPDDTETTPGFTLPRDQQYITLGLGYRYQMFYLDAAYVYRMRHSDYYPWSTSTQAVSLKQHDHNIVLTAGLRF